MSERVAQAAAQAALAGAKPGERIEHIPEGAFARLLDRFAPPLPQRDASAPTGAPVGVWGADGIHRVYVPRTLDLHALVWRAQAPARPHVAQPVALQSVASAWSALLPPLDKPAYDPIPTGFAVFDSGGLRAEYAFAWRFFPNQGWRPEPDIGPEPGAVARTRAAPLAALGALDPICARSPLRWTETCGRCQRHALGRRSFALPLALCRLDCLKPGVPA
jgi:hypothetical protein